MRVVGRDPEPLRVRFAREVRRQIERLGTQLVEEIRHQSVLSREAVVGELVELG